MSKTNKELIKELSGFSMKSEVEVLLDSEVVQIKEIKRVYIPENKETKTAARNIIQISLSRKSGK